MEPENCKKLTETLVIDYEETLGSGAYGTVHPGFHLDVETNEWKKVAIKKIETKEDSFDQDKLLSELV